MKYFRLTDKVGEVPDRWHLGDLTDRSSGEPVVLENGCLFDGSNVLILPVSRKGRPLSYCETSFGIRVATKGLIGKMESLASDALQRIEVEIPGYPQYAIIHVIKMIECLDESRTEFVKWQLGEGRDDLIGGYRIVRNLKIKRESVSDEAHFFGVKGWSVGLIVSGKMKTLMESEGCLGAQFQAVS